MNSPTSVYHDPETVGLVTPFNRDFVDALKCRIPAAYRRWDPVSKAWFVSYPYDAMALQILLAYFPHAEIGARPPARSFDGSRAGCTCDDDHRALHVCQDAPAEVVRAAYRALARLRHPDGGGDVATMQALNAAYERLAGGTRS
jgi:hypothetical protein